MRLVSDYDVVIFDCDGVIFDSNTLKVQAMTEVLKNEDAFHYSKIESAIEHFGRNFGLSRYKHVDCFVEIFNIADENRDEFRSSILANYSSKCVELYSKAQLVPGFRRLIKDLKSTNYVASGSDEDELKQVFKMRGLTDYFSGIHGSPNRKSDIVTKLASIHKIDSIVLIGDSISDFEAASEADIDFIFFAPYSMVQADMRALKAKHGFLELNNF